MHAQSSLIALALLLAATPALACTGQSVYLEGDFNTGDPGWGKVDERFRVDGAEATLTAKPGTQTARWDTGVTLTDMDACVTIAMPEATADASRAYAGMLFWLTDKNDFYEVVIAPNGLFTVARKVGGKIMPTAPVPWTKSDAIKLGGGEENRLRVTLEGQMVAIHINDTEVARFRGQAPAEPSHVGLVAASAPNGLDSWHLFDLKITNVPGTAPDESDAEKSAETSGEISTGAVAAAPGCASGEVLFVDDFKSHDPTWGPADARLEIAKGQAVIKPIPGTRTFRWNRVFLFDDLDACATVRLSKNSVDPTTSYAGLMFWTENSRNYYQAVLAPNGYFTVARVVDGKVTSPRPVEWTKLDNVEKGAKEKNTLRVAAKGDQVTVFVNGKEAASFKGERPRQPSYVGLLAASAQSKRGDTWTITDFQVTKPE
jgi:3-keto-disaccharide hydrolase